MGLNDLQSQLNRLVSTIDLQRAQLSHLKQEVLKAREDASTTGQMQGKQQGGGGGGSGTVTEVETGNGLTGGPITTTGTIAVNPGSGIKLDDDKVTVSVNDVTLTETALADNDLIVIADVSEGGNDTKKVELKNIDPTLLNGGTDKVYYTDNDGDVTELALGADATVLTSNGATAAPTFTAPAHTNPVVWGKLTGDFVTARMAGAAPPFGNAKWCTAIRQETNAGTNTLVEAEDVMVFTLGLHNAFHYENSRVSMVKDDVFTAYKADGKGWYRLTDSPISQEVYCRLKDHPWVDAEANHSWLGEYGEFYVYMNEKASTGDGSTPTLWNAAGNALVGNSDDEWDVRIRTGHALNAKDMYRGQFWPDEDLFIVDQIACIMAYVGAMAVDGSVGCFKWLDDPEDNNFYYPMGKRFNIIGQFEENVVKGETAKFMLGRWSQSSPEDGATPAAGDFEQETIFGTPATSHGSPVTWDITFEAGQVYNAASFTIQGDTSFNDGDVCACQYDESRGVYLAAPLRCS